MFEIRVLLTTLKFLANMPCPRCLTLKSEIVDLGTKLDARRRAKKRVDDEARRSAIERARGWIYSSGRRIRGKAVEAWIGVKSWVPTRVCGLIIEAIQKSHNSDSGSARMRSRKS